MFTGIVEEIGYVRDFKRNSSGATLVINCNEILSDVKVGDSIAVNGVCETVVEFGDNFFKVMVSNETLNVTTFSSLKNGDAVNLERALTLSSRLGGHIVSGHVDCLGKLLVVEKLSDFYNLKFSVEKSFEKYIAYKGSITVNGISLTVVNVMDNTFEIAIIPHTFENTNLKFLKIGDNVNIETDILAKYVEKILSLDHNKKEINMEFLVENGFV